MAQVGPEGEQIEREQERDGPFDDCRRILMFAIEEGAKGDGERDEDGSEYGFEDISCAKSAERATETLVEPSELST